MASPQNSKIESLLTFNELFHAFNEIVHAFVLNMGQEGHCPGCQWQPGQKMVSSEQDILAMG